MVGLEITSESWLVALTFYWLVLDQREVTSAGFQWVAENGLVEEQICSVSDDNCPISS